MDRLEKLLRKVQRKDREHLLAVLSALHRGDLTGLHIQKLSNSKRYRVRVGKFRIQFSFDDDRRITVLSVKLRNEHTYE